MKLTPFDRPVRGGTSLKMNSCASPLKVVVRLIDRLDGESAVPLLGVLSAEFGLKPVMGEALCGEGFEALAPVKPAMLVMNSFSTGSTRWFEMSITPFSSESFSE